MQSIRMYSVVRAGK